MGDQPYRTIGQRASNPSESLTVEQFVDLRLCVSTLSPDQCRELVKELDDHQVKNAVYDRVLCYPNGEFTKGIQETFAKSVNAANKNVISFIEYYNHVNNVLDGWKQVVFFEEGDYMKLETHVKSYISPSIDSIGVHSTLSEYSLTKRNGLTTLVDIGLVILDIPIFGTQQGKVMFTYDCISRAVGNILHSAANSLQRQQLLDHGMEDSLRRLEQRSKEVGIFLSLTNALSPDPVPSPYWLPEIQPQPQPHQSGNKRKTMGHIVEPAKKTKADTYPQQGIVNPQQGIVHQQEGIGHSNQGINDPQNGFALPQQDNANFQHGITEPQQDTASSQQGNVDHPEGTVYPQAGGTTILDSTNTPFNDLIDPRLWETWWPRPEQSASEQPQGVNEGSPAAFDALRNLFSPTSSAAGQTNDPFLDTLQQPGPSGSGTEQEIGQEDESLELEGFDEEMVLLTQLQATTQQAQQYLGPEQMMLAAEQDDSATAPQVQQHQGFELNMSPQPMEPMGSTQKGKQPQGVDQNTTTQYAPRQVQQNQGIGQHMPVQYTTQQAQSLKRNMPAQNMTAAQQFQIQQGLQQNIPAQSTAQQFQLHPGLQQNTPAQPPAARMGRKPRGPRKKNNNKPSQDTAAAQQGQLSVPSSQWNNTPSQNTTAATQQGQRSVPLSQWNDEPASFQDVTNDVYQEMFVIHVDKTPQMQVYMAAVVAGRVELGVLRTQERVEYVSKVYKEKEVLLITQEYALWALLWILEVCAVDRARTPLSGEVSRRLRRDLVVQALWTCVRISSPKDMKRLLHCVNTTSGGVSLEVKLDAIIRMLNNTGATGWEKLQYILDEMRKIAGTA